MSAYCRPCANRGQRTIRAKDRVGERAKMRARYRRHPAKWKAKVYLGRAVARGLVEKVEKCIRCGKGPTEAHHYRGYARKNWLRVQWLCRSCHQLTHRAR